MRLHRLCLVHPFDPRSAPRDVVEQRILTIAAHRPNDFSLLIVGIDERGDLELGSVVAIEVAGRQFDFLAVARSSAPHRFAAGFLARLRRVKAAARAALSSVAVHAPAWAGFARLVGRPLVMVIHRDPRAGAVAGRVSALSAWRERLATRAADRIVACDPDYVRRCRHDDPVAAAKVEQLTILAAPVGDEIVTDARIGRLWERHRRLFDVHMVQRGAPFTA
jgi:hypothetical protein